MKNIFLFLAGFFTFFMFSAAFVNNANVSNDIVASGPLNQALFMNCGNEILIEKPEGVKNISYSAEGATVIPSTDGTRITLVPSQPEVLLTISYDGKTKQQTYQAFDAPSPYVEIVSDGKPVNMKIGVPSPGPRSLTLINKADRFYTKLYPKDVRYKITDWDVILVRGKRPVATNNFKGETGNLTNFSAVAQPGDRILVEVKKATRANFLNKVEEIPLQGATLFNIPLN